MNHFTHENGFVFLGTAGGTLSGFCNVVHSHDLIQTGVLSAFGAIVSFGVSYLLSVLIKKKKE